MGPSDPSCVARRGVADSVATMADWRTPTGLIAAGAVVLTGMGVASFCARADGGDVRARLVQLVARSTARVEARDRDREAAWGETKDGSAYDFYAKATRLLPASTNGTWDAETGQWIENGAPVTAERRAELRGQWAPAVALLGEGAHSRDARANGHLDRIRLTWIVALECSSRLDEGATIAAVQLWLDGFTFARDAGAMSSSPMFVQWTDERLRSLPAEALDLIGAGLERLEARLATMPDPERPIANAATPLFDGSFAPSVRRRLAAWRQGFDVQQQEIEALGELLEAVAVLTPACADEAARSEQWRAFRAAPRRCTTWSSGNAEFWIQNVEQWQRQDLARLRLLRLAVAFHRGAPLPELADPFAAGVIEVRLDGDSAVFRSAGSFPGRERGATRR